MKTSSAALQTALENWYCMVEAILAESDRSKKSVAASRFVATFAPKGLAQDDLDYFTSNVLNDEVDF